MTTSGDYYVVTINEWCTSGGSPCAANSVLRFVIQGVKNPSLLSANYSPISWEALTATSQSYPIDGAYTGLKPTPNLEGVAITLSTVEVASPVVYAETTLSLSFIPNSDLPSNALVVVGLPREFAFAPKTQSCLQLIPSSATLSCTYETSGGYLSSITISNPCSNSNCRSTTIHVYTLAIKIRQNTKNVGESFTVTTKTSTADIGIGSLANSIVIKPNPFDNMKFDNSG